MGKRNSLQIIKRTVDAAPPLEKRYYIWDCDLPGFGMRIEPSGAKIFVVKYRAEGGGRKAPQRSKKIGRYGPLTPEQARKLARAVLGSAAAGEDPAGETQAKRREMTMADLIDFYEEHGCIVQRGKRIGEPMKPLTKQYTLGRLRHHVVPLLGRRKVTEITSGDIERFSADVEKGKTAKNVKVGPRRRIIVRGGPGAARKVVRDLSAVFSFARRSKFVAANPCEHASVRKTDNQKTRFLTLAEVGRLGAAFDALEAEGTNPKALNIARLWALTGCRRNEIAALKWVEVDFDQSLLTFEDTKTGKSVRPLGGAALALLRTIERSEDSEYVFPADTGDGHFQGVKTPWKNAVERAQLLGVTPHTLRHTVGSTAISNGEALALTGAILGHSNPRSTAIYAHVQHAPSKKAANRVSKKIATALLGSSQSGNDGKELSSEDQLLLEKLADRLGQGDASAGILRRSIQKMAA